MREKTFAVRIFDGTYTRIYSVRAMDKETAERKAICCFNIEVDGTVEYAIVTEQRG